MLMFERLSGDLSDRISVHFDTLVIAGWAGRDQVAVEHHIEELAAIGVPRPSSVPVYYRASAPILTQASILTVLGPNTSGEAEPVLVSLVDGLWVGIGSDHTDRKAETFGIALSKQLCGKPIGQKLWRYADVERHWDHIVLRSWATIDGTRILYQEGSLATLRTPRDLLQKYESQTEMTPGSVMFCGTLGAIGGIRPSTHFEMELIDPVLGRSLRHEYSIDILSIAC